MLCGIFLVEEGAVMLQVPVCKYFKRNKLKWDYVIKTPQIPIPEQIVVMRFFLVAIFLAVITFVTLKIR